METPEVILENLIKSAKKDTRILLRKAEDTRSVEAHVTLTLADEVAKLRLALCSLAAIKNDLAEQEDDYL